MQPFQICSCVRHVRHIGTFGNGQQFRPVWGMSKRNEKTTFLKNQEKASKTMSTKKIDAVKYKANDYRVDKKGKRTPSKFAFWVRVGKVWTTAAESGDERAEKFRGVVSADVAAFTLPDILAECGLDVSDGVKTAASAAGERIAAKALKIEKREAETVAKGWDAFRDAKADAAKKSWERLTANVEERAKERAKANAAPSATDATAPDTAENAADIAA